MDNMPKIQQTLVSSIFEVFEKMYYIFLEPAEGSEGDYLYSASINFSGPWQGELKALYSRSLAEAMVSNMLNIEQSEMSDKLLDDCLKESVNMICGNFLRKIDSSQVFDLSLPVFSAKIDLPGEMAATPVDHALRLDFASGDGRLGIIMTVSEVQ